MIVFLLFFTVEGEGVGRQCLFFSPRYMKRWEEGGKGYIGFSGNVFFIVERLGRGSAGVILFTNSLWDGGKGAPVV